MEILASLLAEKLQAMGLEDTAETVRGAVADALHARRHEGPR